jgi:hypothetical protein
MVKHITDRQLDKLERLCTAASEDPWRVGHYDNQDETYTVESDARLICMLCDADSADMGDDARAIAARDFAFIAAAREFLPALVAEVRRLREAEQRELVG